MIVKKVQQNNPIINSLVLNYTILIALVGIGQNIALIDAPKKKDLVKAMEDVNVKNKWKKSS